ncbi:hypothetical protein DS909_08910 [Phaeobacter gallaeciensis]|uniref:HNH nuclease domain-containing protein n=1 Tax=Phaeobacter gallaeciensis TaxID=60890 RepID=A0A366X2E5_9RHOB|nr:HNH endonuclease [Phaeobacter gallaeciensis]RBW56814.1 hypothetical protein DS909_08910 [Phaeobacter gallaeciensis]
MTYPPDIEQWRPVVGVAGYQVSNLGQVRNAANVIMRQQVQAGYATIMIGSRTDGSRKRRSVHRLVCEAFTGPPPTDQHQVAHRDGDSLNNTQWNLQWATAIENAADSIRHGTRPSGEGGNPRLTNSQKSVIRAALIGGATQAEIADVVGCAVTTVRTTHQAAVST